MSFEGCQTRVGPGVTYGHQLQTGLNDLCLAVDWAVININIPIAACYPPA